MKPIYFRIEDFVADYPHMHNRDLQKKYGLTEHQCNFLFKKLKLKKTRRQRSLSAGKLEWTPEEDQFLRDNWLHMNNVALAKALGRKLTNTRTRLYQLGMKRIELEFWTDEMVQFLRENFRKIGDTELAEIFSTKWPKNKGWSKKHIEKKRRYLKLKRTRKEMDAIRQRHIEAGVYARGNEKMWETRGVAKEGEIRYWRASYNKDRPVPLIKIDGQFVHYARYRYEQLHGPVPEGHNVVFLDNNPENIEDNNLGIVTNAELAIRNARLGPGALSDNYVAGMLSRDKELREEIKTNYPELIEIKRKQLILNRIINESL